MAPRTRRRAYGIDNALQQLNNLPIIARRDPRTNDRSVPIGTNWINKLTNDVWILTSITNNLANWEPIGNDTEGGVPITRYVVDGNGGASIDYTTIQSAIDAAFTAGGNATVFVRNGTYTENLTLRSTINVVGATGLGDLGDCVIVGTHVPPPTGRFIFRNFLLQSATHIFDSAVAGSADIVVIDCLTDCTNGYTWNLPNWTGTFTGFDMGETSTNNGSVNNTSGATIFFTNITSGAGSANPMITSGPIELFNTVIQCPCTFGNGTTGTADGGGLFRNSITFTGNGTLDITNSTFITGANTPITQSSSSAILLSGVTINSSADPVIDGAGAGAVDMGNISYLNGSNIAATVTQTYARVADRTTPYVVGPTGNFATIQAALDAANQAGARQSVFIQPGSFTESLTLYDDIVMEGAGASLTTITGIHVPATGGGIMEFHNIGFVSATHVFNNVNPGSSDIRLVDCISAITSGRLFELGNWTGNIDVEGHIGGGGIDGIIVNDTAATIVFKDSILGAGNSTTLNVTDGNLQITGCEINCPLNLDLAVAFDCEKTAFNKVVDMAGSATGPFFNCIFDTGASEAIDFNSGSPISIINSTVNSSNNPAMIGAGAGVITLGGIEFVNNALTAGTLTLSNVERSSSGGLKLVEGTNPTSGIATLVAGTVTVLTTAVTANSRIQLTHQTNAGAPGFVSVTARVGATSFTITSSNAGDTSNIAWLVVEPQ